MGKKYYAVKNGKDGDGIYETWEDCKAQVHGVKSVVYKGFPTRAEAEEFWPGQGRLPQRRKPRRTRNGKG